MSLTQAVRSFFVLPSCGCPSSPIATATYGFSHNSNVARVMHIEFDLLQKKWIDRAWNVYMFREIQFSKKRALPTVINGKERLNKMCAWWKCACALAARKLPHRFHFIKTAHTSTSSCAHITLDMPWAADARVYARLNQIMLTIVSIYYSVVGTCLNHVHSRLRTT